MKVDNWNFSKAMNIGLVDVDGGKFPNLALMKIARWHRMQGDDVEWADPIVGLRK